MKKTSKMKTTPKMEICSNVGGIVYYLKKLFMTTHIDSHSTTDPKPEIQSAVPKRKKRGRIVKISANNVITS